MATHPRQRAERLRRGARGLAPPTTHRRRLASLRQRLTRLWLLSPERLWLLSIALNRRGHWLLAFSVKQLNTILYHNSLAAEASVAPDVLLGHYGHGIVVGADVVIGRRVKIWHNVTLTAGRRPLAERAHPVGPPPKLIIEDGVRIGANAVVIGPRGRDLRIGRGARIGAGVVVTKDVPAHATVVSAPPRVLLEETTDATAEMRRSPGESTSDDH
jgi:serine O-acetyltransferase